MTNREMDQIGKRLRAISNEVRQYMEKRMELLIFDISEHVTRMLAESVHKVAGILFLLGSCIFLLVALALYLGEILGSESLGYVLVSVPILIVGLFLISLKPRSLLLRIQKQFMREVLRALPEQNGKMDKIESGESKKPESGMQKAPSKDGKPAREKKNMNKKEQSGG